MGSVVDMAKVIIVYDSQSGFTEAMAKAVAEGANTVEGVDVDVFKVGTPFSISELDKADAIVIGSPTIYGSVTSDMNVFLDCVKVHKESEQLQGLRWLSGKVGGVFGSYGWDGGWVIEKLGAEMKALGIEVTAPAVSIVHDTYDKRIHLDADAQQKCTVLGRSVAEKVSHKT